MTPHYWSTPNAIPCPVIAPDADIKWREEHGLPTPDWPAHICITSPYRAVNPPESATIFHEPTPAHIEAVARRKAKRQAIAEENRRLRKIESERRKDETRRNEALNKALREKRAAENKRIYNESRRVKVDIPPGFVKVADHVRHVSSNTLSRAAQTGRIKGCIKIKRIWYAHETAIAAYLKKSLPRIEAQRKHKGA